MREHRLLRERQMQEARKKMDEYDQKITNDAKNAFLNKKGLREAINTEILPSLTAIRTQYGMIGMGFFQHSQWMISNAHIISDKSFLEDIRFIDANFNEQEATILRSFHRPSDNDFAPDVVTVNMKRNNGSDKCLPINFSESEDYSDRLIFYINLNYMDDQFDYELKFLRDLSQPSKYPLIYECADGVSARQGSSGTPIIEARVLIGREPKWEFRVIGVLYARCSTKWYDKFSAAKRTTNPETKLVCAIPARPELNQILHKIIHPEEMAKRAELMAYASQAIHDEEKRKAYEENKRESQELAKIGIEEFEEGATYLNIELPDGLEKLWVSWHACNYYGLRVDRPAIPQYTVNPNHSNHHIIPIYDLLYLWDYLHYLDDATRIQLKSDVKQAATALLKEKQAALKEEINKYYPNERKTKWTKGTNDIRSEIKKFKADEFKKRYISTLKANYDKFHVLLATLCLPNAENRTYFAWSFWNLFKGWEKDYRENDPSSFPGRNRSEPNKPNGFDSILWASIKTNQNCLYHVIQDLKQLKKQDRKIEGKLYVSMSALADAWKRDKVKSIWSYNKDDWEVCGQKNGHEIYRLVKQ